jgi:hypothetical protein
MASHGRLLGVTIVHRHGDRSPIQALLKPSAKYWTNLLARAPPAADIPTAAPPGIEEGLPTPYGQLTELGAAQMHNRGLELRQYLLDAAPHLRQQQHIPPSAVRVISTPFPRTMLSNRALLSGLMSVNVEDTARTTALSNWVHGPGISHSISSAGWADMIPDMNVCDAQVAAEAAALGTDEALVRVAEATPKQHRLAEMLAHFGVLQPGDGGGGGGAPVPRWGLLHDAIHCAHIHGAAGGLPTALCDVLGGAALGKTGSGAAPIGAAASDLAELAALVNYAGEHNAWRWFALQSDPEVARLSVGPFVTRFIRGA